MEVKVIEEEGFRVEDILLTLGCRQSCYPHPPLRDVFNIPVMVAGISGEVGMCRILC